MTNLLEVAVGGYEDEGFWFSAYYVGHWEMVLQRADGEQLGGEGEKFETAFRNLERRFKAWKNGKGRRGEKG